MIIQNYSCCYSEIRAFIFMPILMTHHAHILDVVVHLWVKGVFRRERVRKGCDFSILNFRDISAFQNFPDTHVNIGFHQSEPRGGTFQPTWNEWALRGWPSSYSSGFACRRWLVTAWANPCQTNVGQCHTHIISRLAHLNKFKTPFLSGLLTDHVYGDPGIYTRAPFSSE